MTPRDLVQAVDLVLALAGIVLWSRWAYQNPKTWRYAFPILVWLAHATIFYIAEAFFIRQVSQALILLTQTPFSDWSAILRLHALLSLALAGWAFTRK